MPKTTIVGGRTIVLGPTRAIYLWRNELTMTPQVFLEKMQAIYKLKSIRAPIDRGYNPEESHIDADDLMCEVLEQLGYQEGVKIFRHADKWYA
jgi:hypothetical protein